MNPPQNDIRPAIPRTAGPKRVDEYLAALDELAKRGDKDIQSDLKIPSQPRDDEEVRELRERLRASQLEPTDKPDAFVQIANVVVSREALRLARAGLRRSSRRGRAPVPAVAFIVNDSGSKSISTLILEVPDSAPPLMDLATAIFWSQLNVIPFGSATLVSGVTCFYEIENCAPSMLDEGHLQARLEEKDRECASRVAAIEATREQAIREAKASTAARIKSLTSQLAESERAKLSLREFSLDRDRGFKIFRAVVIVFTIPGVLKLGEWLSIW
jgi:hypothetical protein